MNSHNFTPLPKTEFQYQGEIVGEAVKAVNRAYNNGFCKGEIVGAAREKARNRLSESKAMGIGFIFGIAACATVIALYVGWPL